MRLITPTFWGSGYFLCTFDIRDVMNIKLASVVHSMRRWSARSITYALERVSCSAIALKTEQRDCISHLYEGKDVFLWLPTGFGKSLCYEVLPFVIRDGDDKLGRHGSVVIVISCFSDG